MLECFNSSAITDLWIRLPCLGLNFLIFNKFSLIFHKTTDFLALTSYSPLELLQYQYDPITVLTSSLSCQEFLF